MDKAMYYELINGNHLLLSDKLGYYCSPGTHSMQKIIINGLEEVGWDVTNVSSKEFVGAKPIMRGAMLRW